MSRKELHVCLGAVAVAIVAAIIDVAVVVAIAVVPFAKDALREGTGGRTPVIPRVQKLSHYTPKI
eukprot:4700276-Amphidinium_carterae.1